MTITRSLLKDFNPRLRAEFEALSDLLDNLDGRAAALKAELDAVETGIGDFQQSSDFLTAISALPNRSGAVEATGDNGASIRPIDGADPASLMTRGAAYQILVAIAGKGITANRPTVPSGGTAIYFDTTLAANGKPIFWTGTQWVDSAGTAV